MKDTFLWLVYISFYIFFNFVYGLFVPFPVLNINKHISLNEAVYANILTKLIYVTLMKYSILSDVTVTELVKQLSLPNSLIYKIKHQKYISCQWNMLLILQQIIHEF